MSDVEVVGVWKFAGSLPNAATGAGQALQRVSEIDFGVNAGVARSVEKVGEKG